VREDIIEFGRVQEIRSMRLLSKKILTQERYYFMDKHYN